MWENYLGQPIICCPDRTILVRHKFETTCYDHSNFFHFNSKGKYRMISMQGHRFDYQHHNWILLRENLSLSFSYMSFVIRSQFIHLVTQTIKNDEQKSSTNHQQPIPYRSNIDQKSRPEWGSGRILAPRRVLGGVLADVYAI